jgi:hypothetical protein
MARYGHPNEAKAKQRLVGAFALHGQDLSQNLSQEARDG